MHNNVNIDVETKTTQTIKTNIEYFYFSALFALCTFHFHAQNILTVSQFFGYL